MLDSNHPLVANWKSADDFDEVVISLFPKESSFEVKAVDNLDGESAEIFDRYY